MRFSVIIPNYNKGKKVRRCLESIRKQTFKDYEILFIDDMSTDESIDIAREYCGVIELQSKRLNGGARNEGIIRARGEYCIFIDSDDYFKNERVFEEIDKALNGEDVLFLGYETWFGDSSIPYMPEHKRIEDAIMHCVCAIWTKVVKTEILKRNLFPEGTLFEDRTQHYKVLMDCKSFKNLEINAVLWDRSDEGNTSKKKNFETYEGNFVSEMMRIIPEVKSEELRKYYIDEVKRYAEHIKEMVGEYDKA